MLRTPFIGESHAKAGAYDALVVCICKPNLFLLCLPPYKSLLRSLAPVLQTPLRQMGILIQMYMMPWWSVMATIVHPDALKWKVPTYSRVL